MSVNADRREVIRGAALGFASLSVSGIGPSALATGAPALPPFFADVERRTFDFFWDRANPRTGLSPDRWPTPAPASIAAVGFALTAYPIGVQRGWVSREAARDRTLTTLRFLSELPMGDAPRGVAGHRGFFYHFLDMETGLRAGQSELSTADTALLHMGILFAAGVFERDDPAEAEIRRLATELVDRAEWDWFQQGGTAISMGWHPDTGFLESAWDGYNEGKLVYVLALGSGRHPARDGSWSAWTAPYDRLWRGEGAQRRLAFAPLFGHQFSELWIDFRGIFDEPMRAAGFDYFENGRRATYADRAYCIANPLGWEGYERDIWGLTACDGPGDLNVTRGGRVMAFRGYSARGPKDDPDGYDDGTLAPTASISSMPFAPEICIPAALALHRRYGARLYGQYGFRDSFNPSFREGRVETGSVDPETGWVATDWLGIDQGPILGMLANYRDDTVWRVMRCSRNIQRGLRRAGFGGGWLSATPSNRTIG